VWAHHRKSAFAAGGGGVILYYNGHDWQKMPLSHKNTLYSIWGASYTNVWAVGEGLVLRFDGANWNQIPLPPILRFVGSPKTIRLSCVRTIGGFEAYIAGEKGTILCWQDGKWENIVWKNKTNWTETNWMALWPDQKMLYVVGENATLAEVPF
jgi:hypothetical protein